MGISVDVVCNDSTKGLRAVTTRMKNQVYTDYAVASHPTGAYEIDHFIPLELGAATISRICGLNPRIRRLVFTRKTKWKPLCTTRSAKPTR